MEYDRIPPYLKDHARFCVWAYRNRDGKRTKIPYDPHAGRKARSNDQTTFASFQQAKEALERRPGDYSGLGIGMFGELVGVDIDHCIDETGELSSLAREVVDKLGSYAERSPGGDGVHILCRTRDLPYTKGNYLLNNRDLGLEVYPAGHTNRFLTLTGNALNSEDVNIRTDEIMELLEKYMRKDRTNGSSPVGSTPMETTATSRESDIFDDAELIDRMLKSTKGEHIAHLWAGDWEWSGKYGSQSEADQALCNHLAFWARKDPVQMDRLFRQSGLMRKKWDRGQSGSTYGRETIQKAIAGTKTVWNPGYGESQDQRVAQALRFLRENDVAHNGRYPRTDVGAGDLLADYLKPFARAADDGKVWFIYDGVRWSNDSKAKVKEAAKDMSRALARYAADLPESEMKDYLDWARKWSDGFKRERYIKEAASVYEVKRGAFDENIWLLNLNNGTLDLRTMEFRDHSPDDMLSHLAPVDYDPDAACPRWERFIQEIMVPGESETKNLDKEIVAAEKADFLQRYLGYCLCGDTSAESFLIMYGPTSRNGKSVCVGTVQTILGDYAKSMTPESLMVSKSKDGRGPSENIARLNGIRMASVSEIQQGARLDASLVKQLTGGDKMTARFLGENSFDFFPQCKLLMHTNHLPQCSDLSVFDSGRALVLTFGRHFEEWEQDKGLKAELRKPENQSGILNWLLQGFREYRKRGLTPPKSVRLATQEYRKDSDKIARFMEETLKQDVLREVRLTLLYSAYKIWCQDNGQYPESSRVFKRSLEQAGVHIVKKRPNEGGENTTMVVGFSLLSEYAMSA